MADSETPAQWDVVVLPFPYTDRLAEKRRPALVVSKPWLAKKFGLVWVAMITSVENQRWADDVNIGDLAKAGLQSPSVIRPVKLATIDAVRVIRKIGKLRSKEIATVKAVLSKVLA